MIFKKFLGLAQKVLCLGLCVSLLGTSGFYGVAHASEPQGQVMDLNGGPYSSITGNNMDGVCLRNTTSGKLKLNKDCKIIATGTNSKNMVGIRMINDYPGTPYTYGVSFTNSAIISSHNVGGSATGFGVQNLGVSTWGNALTIDGVKSEADLGLAIGFSTGDINYSGTPDTTFVTAQVNQDRQVVGKGADLTIKNIESTQGSAAGIFANPKITIITNGGNIVVQNVSAYKDAYGASFDKASEIRTNGGNLIIENVKNTSTNSGSAYGLKLDGGATVNLIKQDNSGAGDVAVRGVEGFSYGVAILGNSSLSAGKLTVENTSGRGLTLYESTLNLKEGNSGGNILIQNIFGSYGVVSLQESCINTNGGDITIKNVLQEKESRDATGLTLYDGATLELMNQGDTKSGVLTIDGVTATGANSVAIGYDIHNATDDHQGSVIISNVKATGTNGKAAAIVVTSSGGEDAVLALGYKGAQGQYLTGATYRIDGDIVAAQDAAGEAKAKFYMAVQNPYSFLHGNLSTVDPTGINTNPGYIKLHVTSGGSWYPIFNNGDTLTAPATIKLSEGGVVDIAYTGLNISGSMPSATYDGQRNFRTLTINELDANGGAFVVNTDVNAGQSDKIILTSVIDSTAGAKGIKVLVAHDPVMDAIKIPSATKIDLETPIEIVKVNGGSLTKVEGGKFKVSKGANSYETEATFEQSGDDWGLKSLSFKLLGLSPTAIATRSVAKAVGLSFINITNTLQKRLGDLRSGAGSNIGWVRFMRTNNYTDDIKLNGNQYQVGYDRQISSDDISKRYFGVAIDQYDGNNSFDSGNSDVKSTTLGVYYTRMFESGHYYDFIFRYGRTYGDWTSFDASLPSPVTTADFGVNSVSISGEYGYRWNIGKAGFYIEPQVELIAGYVSSSNNRTSAGDLVYMDSTRHFITRGGIAFGQRAKNLNYYLRFSYNHDFAGDLNVDFAGENIKSESPKNWLDATLGLGWLMKDNCYLYGEVSKNYKDITNSLNFNVGFRITL